MAINLSSLSDTEFLLLAEDIGRHRGLNDVLVWAAGKPKDEMHPQIVAEVITQDEFTHDVIVPTNIYF